jgi:hypothetical protein
MLPESTSGPRTLNQTLQASGVIATLRQQPHRAQLIPVYLQTAIEFVKRQKSRDAHSSHRQNKMQTGFPAFDASPLVKALSESESTGFILLNNEWDIVKVALLAILCKIIAAELFRLFWIRLFSPKQANPSFCRLLGLHDGDCEGSVLKGRSLFSVVHAADVLGLREYASQLSASKNPSGDKVLLNLRFANFHCLS